MQLVAGKYVDDRGVSWQMLVGEEYFDQAGLGWTAATATDPVLTTIDRKFKPRVVLVLTSNGKSRRIVCATKTATAYQGTIATIFASESDNETALVAKIYGYEGERRRFRRGAAPSQS